MAFPAGTEEFDHENELWFSIAWNPQCGEGRTRVVHSRCMRYMSSLLERCNGDSEEKWGGQVVGICLVYNMSSTYGQSVEPLVAVVNGTVDGTRTDKLISRSARLR